MIRHRSCERRYTARYSGIESAPYSTFRGTHGTALQTQPFDCRQGRHRHRCRERHGSRNGATVRRRRRQGRRDRLERRRPQEGRWRNRRCRRHCAWMDARSLRSRGDRPRDRGNRRSLRRHRHPRQQRRHFDSDRDRQREVRSGVAEVARRVDHRAHAHDPRGASASAQVEVGAHSEHCVDRRARRDALRQSVHRRETRRDRLNAVVGGGARSRRHHRQLHLPRSDPHRHDAGHSGRQKAGIRAPTRCACAAMPIPRKSLTAR